MTKKYIVYYPNPGGCIRENLYVEKMINVLSEHYHVVGVENISNNIHAIKQVKCIILNWAELSMSSYLKRRLWLYKFCRVKIFWVFHNKLPHDCEKATQIKDMIWLADFCDRIILLSQNSAKYIPHLRKNKRKGVFVPHINYIGAYPECIKRDIRNEYKIGEDTVVFSFLGLLRPYKNIDLIINAFEELNLSNAVLLIAGKTLGSNFGSNLIELTKRNNDIILELGYISNGEIEAYLRASDILVLPYNKASSMNSGAMVMAFSYGKTVIVPQIAMAEDFLDSEVAFIYDYSLKEDNYEALKKEMSRAYNIGRKSLIRMGGRAKKYVEKYNGKLQVVGALQEAGVL